MKLVCCAAAAAIAVCLLPFARSDLIPIRHSLFDPWPANPFSHNPRYYDHVSQTMANMEREMREMELALAPFWQRRPSPVSSFAQTGFSGSSGAAETEVKDQKDKFLVDLDVAGFAPEDIKVQVQDDFLVVEAKQEQSDKNGFVSRQFSRRYLLPKDVDQSAIKSYLGKGGVLSIEAKKIAKEPENVREIPIEKIATEEAKNKKKKELK